MRGEEEGGAAALSDTGSLLDVSMFETPRPASYVPGSGPRNAVVILLDSLNRHMLGSYGGSEFATPNLDRLAARSLRFTRHYSGSLPCMPARHDILCGALDFLWKPWGSIELWEEPITSQLRMAGVKSQLISDHPHLFESGGENYHCDFGAWEYLRGHESDPWKLRPDPSWVGTPALPAATEWERRHYDDSRTYFREEADFPGPKTMSAAARWIEENVNCHERFFLFVDEFDPHEPFDTPEPWTYLYHDQRDSPLIIWPPYGTDVVAREMLTPAQGAQVRANYGAKLSMIDHWLGKVLDSFDRYDLWDDTAVIVLTDHGHYLGERDTFGKPPVPVHNTLGHIPLLLSWPGVTPGVRDALTTSVDIHATLCDIFDVTPEHRVHGRSLRPIVEGKQSQIRDYILQGYWGRTVNVIDADGLYVRGIPNGNEPLGMWSNRWSTLGVRSFPRLRLPHPDDRAVLDRMPGSNIPVIHQLWTASDVAANPLLGYHEDSASSSLFDARDEDQLEDLGGSAREAGYEELLRHAFEDVDAPSEQFERMGLAR
ncbi:MAG: sulfatase [Actinobacteria bacterium]|nr:sulfatase [Actinomycetota bacterium]